MRLIGLLFSLVLLCSVSAFCQRNRHYSSAAPAPCNGEDLTFRRAGEDAAMGGHRTVDYSVVNSGTRRCEVNGYPEYVLLNSAGRTMPHGIAIDSEKLTGEDKRQPPSSVVLGAGESAWFRVYFNSGGAGHIGKPCAESQKVRITAPSSKKSIVLREKIQSCTVVQVSSIRAGTPQ